MTPSLSPPHPPARRPGSPVAWNRAVAVPLLLLAGWTLIADLAHRGHFLLQSSLSTLFLGLHVTLWSLAAVILAAFPKRFAATAVILLAMRMALAWPLLYWFDLRSACLLLDGALALLAGAYLTASWHPHFLAGRPWFRWQHSAAMGLTVLLVSVLSVPASLLGLARVIEDSSAGYVRLTPGGIDFTERIFEKDGRRVHLVGVAHIADEGFYETLNHSLSEPVDGRRLVLIEGVSDQDQILPRSFATGETYRNLARKLGLAEQALGFAVQSGGEESGTDALAAWSQLGVDFRHADIDVRELDPVHQERLVALLTSLEQLDLASLFTLPDGMNPLDLEQLIVEGLIKRRNARLMEVFAAHEADYAEIFIPWGAAHLPDLERRLASLGYFPAEERRRRGIDFWRRFRQS